MNNAASKNDSKTEFRKLMDTLIKMTGADPNACLSMRITSSKQAGTMVVLANALVETACDSIEQKEKETIKWLNPIFRELTFASSKITGEDPKATLSMHITSPEQARAMILLACILVEPVIEAFRELYEKMEGTYQERKPFSLVIQNREQPYCRITGQPCDKIAVPIDDKKTKDICIKAKCAVAKNFYKLAQELQKTK